MAFPSSLRVATLPSNLWMNFSGDLVYGPDFYILQYLTEKLRTQYNVEEVPPNQFYGSLREEKYDIGIAMQGAGYNKFKYVDFTVPYHIYDVRFIAEQPGELPKYGAFWYPFSSGVWIACIVVAFLATLLTKWITASKASLTNTFISIVGSMLRQPLDVDIASLKKAIWWTTWLIWATVMSTAYSALFLSFLAAPGRERGVKNFMELSKAVQRKKYSSLFMEPLNLLLLESPEEHLRSLGQAMAENSWYYTQFDLPEMGKTRAVIGNREFLESLDYDPPNRVKVFSEDSLVVDYICILVKKNFCCMEQLNLVMLEATAMGMFDYLWNQVFTISRWERELQIWEYPNEEDTATALSMEDLKYIFFLLLIGHSISLAIFLCEVFNSKSIVEGIMMRCHRFAKRQNVFKKKK